jgi:hypothetical protein
MPLGPVLQIQLECGHVVHFQCAEKKIATGELLLKGRQDRSGLM